MAKASISTAIAAISSRVRRAPLGILLVASFFSLIGIGSIVAAFYLLLRDGTATLLAGGFALLIGPAIIYLAYHLISLARWAWLALMVLTLLLFASSLVRIAVSPGLPKAALAEIAVETAAAYYLSRARIRSTFGWAAP